MKLESTAVIMDGDAFYTRTEAEPTHNFGETVRLADGREFRYVKAGAAALAAGKLSTAPVPIANHVNMACAAATAGTFLVTVTPGATGGAANIYAEGYLCINDVDGEGQTYKIKSHPAITASVAFTVTLFDPIATALTANSEATLVHNSYNGVVEGVSTTVKPAGVPLIAIAIGDFGWVQTKGIASVLSQGTTSQAAPLMAGSVAGSVTDQTDVTAPITQYWVGRALINGVDTEYRPVYLDIA
ncbi:MAG: hypothetical protein QME66_04195 [Candidatus Eisenbacteria bacterium]|nr:hypothetical protein [Candidatus Eisenbacteria bacterium]